MTKQKITGYCRLLAFLAAAAYITSKLPIHYFIFDLLDHPQAYYFVFFVFILLLSIFYLKDTILVKASVSFICIASFVTIYPLHSHLSFSFAEKNNDIKSIKILTANVLYKNENYSQIKNLVENTNADIFSMIEMSPEQNQALGEFLRHYYPYYFVRPANNPSGIAVFSRFPLINARFADPAQDAFGVVSGTISIDNKPYNLLVMHPFPPIHQNGLIRRSRVNAALPDIRQNAAAPTIVLGDFNNTLWSREFPDILRQLNVQVHWQSPTTWPAIRFFPRIGIDHILIPESSHFISIKRGPDIGSDHYPVIAEVVL